jgi:hypothetical protein
MKPKATAPNPKTSTELINTPRTKPERLSCCPDSGKAAGTKLGLGVEWFLKRIRWKSSVLKLGTCLQITMFKHHTHAGFSVAEQD